MLSKRKSQQKHLRVRDCYTHNHLHISLCFSQFLPLHLYIFERLLAQTLTTPILSVKLDFGAIGKHWNEPFIGGCNWVELQDLKSQRRQGFEKSIGSRSLEGLSTWGRLGLEGLLLFVYSKFILQQVDFDLEGHGEVFLQVLWFPLQ